MSEMTQERLEEIQKMSLELIPTPWVEVVNELLDYVEALQRSMANDLITNLQRLKDADQ